MPFPPLTPLEIQDFSGGITDNFMQGDPRRSQVLDNWLIQPDKSIKVRPAIVAMSGENYQIGTQTQRINGMYFLINEKYQFAQTGRRLYVLDPAGSNVWTQMSGLNSVDAISGGDQDSQASFAEFQRQVYWANDGIDGQGVLPSKIYQDTTNTWRAKTAGLPKASVSGTYTTASLLAKCIINANALRAAMISHMQDAVYSTWSAFTTALTTTNLHMNQDRYSLSYLTAITFSSNIVNGDPEIPAVLPTPAPAASDQATLLTLVGALNLAYQHHVTESSGGSLNPLGANASGAFYFQGGAPGSLVPNATAFYHMRPTVNASTGSTKPQMGPYASLTSASTPTTVAQAATMLDDLLQKWNWHRKAIWTHSPTNDPQQFDKYIPQCTAVGTVTTGNSTPVVAPDYTDIVNYANNLKTIYQTHVAGTGLINVVPGNFGHTRASHPMYSLDLNCYLSSATDLDSAYLMIYWLRALYYLHYKDANVASAFVGFTYTSTSGSATLSAVTKNSDNSVISAFPVAYLTTGGLTGAMTLQPFAGESKVTMAYAGANSLVMDRLATSSVVGQIGQYSSSVYHCSSSGTSFADSAAGSLGQATDALSNASNSLGTDTTSWLVLASDFFYALTSHMAYRNVHIPTYSGYASVVSGTIFGTTTPFFIPAVSQVSYAYFFSDAYTTGLNGISYLVRSNPVVSASTQVAITYPVNYTIPTATPTVYPSVVNTFTRSNVISGLPVLVNSGNTNYDTSNVLLNIYRTINGGQTYYLLAQVANGTTSYTDSTNDTLSNANGGTALNLGQTMYTTGGTVGSDQPPICKFTHIFNGTAYYAGVQDSGQFFPNQLRQSVQNAPDWVPATFSDTLDDEITGISSTKSNVIALCKNSIYRMSGGYSQTGQGAITHDRISDVVGSLNMSGVVKTEVGVFFPGNDGFYYTDGYQVIKISLELNKTYLTLTASDRQKRAIYGAYDKATRRVWWSMQATPDDTENSIVYVYYLDFGIKPSGTFSTISNGTNFKPASLAFSKGVLYLGSGNGKLLKTDEHQKYDYDITGAGAGLYIPYNWTSSAIDLGTTAHRKYMTKIHVTGQNFGNVALQMSALKDLNATGIGAQAMAPIAYNENVVWGKPTCVWGTASEVWKLDGKMDVWRRFPKKTLRSDFMQLLFQPSFQVVYASVQDYPVGANATVSTGATKTVTLLTPSGYTSLVFYDDVIGYYIKFDFDSYATSYLITASAGTSLTITDPSGTLIQNLTTGYKWEIWGYKKQQRPWIQSAQLTYSYTGDTNQAYPGAKSNSGSGNAGGNPT